RPGRVHVGRVLRGLTLRGLSLLAFGRVRAEQLGDVRPGRLPRHLHARLAQRPVDLGERVAELVVHVGDAKLEECGALADALGASRVLLARELDDEAAPPRDLDDWPGGAELV